MKGPVDLAALRKEYARASLEESDLAASPFLQFERWLSEAVKAGLTEPNAMTLATVDARSRPHARIVLLKAWDENGFVFFTSYQSHKGQEMATNPAVALVFYWGELERQVRIEGRAVKLDRGSAEHYFRGRPRGAQLSAYVSKQSQPVASRAVLEAQIAEAEQSLQGKEVPVPSDWGGYRCVPDSIEFWQGRASRLHDRIQFRRDAANVWLLQRLYP